MTSALYTHVSYNHMNLLLLSLDIAYCACGMVLKESAEKPLPAFLFCATRGDSHRQLTVRPHSHTERACVHCCICCCRCPLMATPLPSLSVAAHWPPVVCALRLRLRATAPLAHRPC